MMPRIILLCFGTTVLLVAVRRMRTYRLKERHVLMFILTGLPFLALSIWPAGLWWISQRLHIDYHTISMLCIAAFLILVIFEMLTIISLQDRKISTLAQIVGIMMEKEGITDRPRSEEPEEEYQAAATERRESARSNV
jgi:small-conductance mechanosensitive channel